RRVEVQVRADVERGAGVQEAVADQGAAAAGVVGVGDVAVAAHVAAEAGVAEAAVALGAARDADGRPVVRHDVEVEWRDVGPGLQGAGVLVLPSGGRGDGVEVGGEVAGGPAVGGGAVGDEAGRNVGGSPLGAGRAVTAANG